MIRVINDVNDTNFGLNLFQLFSHALTRRGDIELAFDYLHAASSQTTNKEEALKYKLHSALLALKLSTSQPSKSSDWLKKADKLLSNGGNQTLVQLVQGVVLKKMKSLK